jgi:hypothetical protein
MAKKATRKRKPQRKKISRKKATKKTKKKTVLSVKSGKASATMELRGLKPTAGTASYGKS